MFVSRKEVKYSYTILALLIINVFLVLFLGIFIADVIINGNTEKNTSLILYGMLFLIVLSFATMLLQTYVTLNSNNFAYYVYVGEKEDLAYSN